MIQPEFGQLSFQESDVQVVRKFNALYGSNTRPRAILNGENVYFSSLERADGVQEPNGLKIGDAFWDQKQIYIKCSSGLVFFKDITTSQGKMKAT